MHHELLQALAGYPGNAFIVSKETGLFEVGCMSKLKCVPFLLPLRPYFSLVSFFAKV